MELQEIEVIIEKDGRVVIQVRGVKGTACLELTKELEQLLGGQIETREMQPEAYEGQATIVEKRQEQRSR